MGYRDDRDSLDDAARPAVGDRAPDFTLRRTFTEQVTLADRWPRGPVVLAFYVFDFGPV